MSASTEKRSYHRCDNEIPIWLTRFNTGNWSEAQTLNHCTDGVRVKSNFYLRPGTNVLIRIKNSASDCSSTYTAEGLPTMSLGEVKWCRENSDVTQSYYDVGVKYFAPLY